MRPYPLKVEILAILAQHKEKWLKSRTVAQKADMNTPDGINRVSNILYRLRKYPYIQKREGVFPLEYRYHEDEETQRTWEKWHPTNIQPIKRENPFTDKKAGNGENNHFEFVERIENEEGYCEVCGLHTTLSYRAEKEGCLVYLCKKHGDIVNTGLCGYAEVFQ